MADVVNLNKARKRKAKADKQAKAAENRVRFGQPKEDDKARKARREALERKLDGVKLVRPPSTPHRDG